MEIGFRAAAAVKMAGNVITQLAVGASTPTAVPETGDEAADDVVITFAAGAADL
jgi:hypothetical protein